MKIFPALLVLCLPIAGCASATRIDSGRWYDAVEVPCHRTECPRCRGAGAVGCSPCRSRGWLPCTECKDGTEKCAACGGDGQKNARKCKECGGDGKRACSTCGGDRKVTCGVCGGPGKLVCLRSLKVTEPCPGEEDVWPRDPGGP